MDFFQKGARSADIGRRKSSLNAATVLDVYDDRDRDSQAVALVSKGYGLVNKAGYIFHVGYSLHRIHPLGSG